MPSLNWLIKFAGIVLVVGYGHIVSFDMSDVFVFSVRDHVQTARLQGKECRFYECRVSYCIYIIVHL